MERWTREFGRRMREDGVRDTWKWLFGHGVPTVFGIPIIKYHRVDDRIYLGPQQGKFACRLLASIGVTASVSMRTEYDDVNNGVGFSKYLQLPTQDGMAPSVEQLEQGADFIQHVIDNGGAVYVHCQTGLGRGPTMVIAYLIGTGLTFQQAYEMVESVRPFTSLTKSQFERLSEFERSRTDVIS